MGTERSWAYRVEEPHGFVPTAPVPPESAPLTLLLPAVLFDPLLSGGAPISFVKERGGCSVAVQAFWGVRCGSKNMPSRSMAKRTSTRRRVRHTRACLWRFPSAFLRS